MKANETPEKIYIIPHTLTDGFCHRWFEEPFKVECIEYTRTDAFIEKFINFLNYKLDDVVATRVVGTIIPHHIAKQELIEDLKKYMKGE